MRCKLSIVALLLIWWNYSTAQSSTPRVEPNADPVLHVENINTCDLSNNGKVLLTGDAGGILTLWDTDTKKSIRRLDFRLPIVKAMMVNDDKDILSLHSAIGRHEVRIMLSNIMSGDSKKDFELSGPTNPSTMSLDRRYFVDSTFHMDYNERDLILVGNFREWYLINTRTGNAPQRLQLDAFYLAGHFDPKEDDKIILYSKDENENLRKTRHDLTGKLLEEIALPYQISMKNYSLKKEYRTSTTGLKFFGQVICVPDTATKFWTGDYYFYDLKYGYADTITKNEFYHQIRDVKFNADGSRIAFATGFVTGKAEADSQKDEQILGDVVIRLMEVRSQASHLSRMSKQVHHRLGVNSLFWTDNGSMVLSVGDDKLILKTQVDSIKGFNVHINPNPGQIFYDVSNDLERIVFSRPGKSTGLWNITDENATLLEQSDTSNIIVKFLENDTSYVSASNELFNNQLKSWNRQIRNNWQNSDPLKSGFAHISYIEPSNKSNHLFISGSHNRWAPPSGVQAPKNATLVKLNLDNKEVELKIPLKVVQIEKLELSPDEKFIACFPPSVNRIEIYNTVTGDRKKFNKDIWDHTFSKDKHYAASLLKGLDLRIWNTQNDSVYSYLLEEWPSEYIFRPGTHEILFLYNNGKLVRFNFITGTEISSIKIEQGFVANPVISPDGNYLYIQSDSKGNLDSKIYDLKTSELLFSPNPHYPPEPPALYENPRQNCHFGGKKFVLTGDNYGSYQLWDLKNRKLAANLKIIAPGEWIIFSPEGLYDGSDMGRQKMYYTVGTEIVRLDQIMEKFWRPGLMSDILNRRDIPLPSPILLYPEIDKNLVCNYKFLKAKMTPREGGIGEVQLSINGIKRPGDFNPDRSADISIPFDTLYSYFTPGVNEISIQAFDASGVVHSRDVSCSIDFTSGSRGSASSDSVVKIDTSASQLYAIIVGTSKYDDPNLTLNYPDRDAIEMTKMLKTVGNESFKVTNIYELISQPRPNSDQIDSKKSNIIKVLQEVQQKAGPNDVFIIYLSGHGEAVEGDFYYKTKEIDDSKSLTDPQVQKEHLLSSKEISEFSQRIKASKQLLIFDACKSGSAFAIDSIQEVAAETSRKKALENYLGQKGIFFLASSESDKNSFESSILKNGILTFTLLRGLGGGAIGNNSKKGSIEILPLLDYASKETIEISDKLIGPEVKYTQRPQMKTLDDESESFQIGVVVDSASFPKPFNYPYLSVIRFSNKDDVMTDDTHEITDKFEIYLEEKGGTFDHNMDFFYWNGNAHKDVYNLLGNYMISQDSITVFWGLKKSSKIVGQLKWTKGLITNLKDVFERIKNAALIEIKKSESNSSD